MSIQSARIEAAESGTPLAACFGDVYHPTAGARAQAEHVFLRGCGLPERWRGRPQFTVLETGFGLGNNFLTLLAAWRDDAQRCDRLHVVSIDAHPPTCEDLAHWLGAGGTEDADRNALIAQWPPAIAGLHRLQFADGRVTLTLALGDVQVLLPKLAVRADAIFMDGFAPAKNPTMWDTAVCKALAERAAPGALLATWCATGQLRRNLADCGFVVEKQPGFGHKREMTVARWPGAAAATTPAPRHAATGTDVIVVGAGLAGAAVAASLARRGLRVAVLERDDEPAARTSSHLAAAFRPAMARGATPLSRLTLAGCLLAAQHWPQHAWQASGTLQMEQDGAEGRALLDAQAWPADFARWVKQDEAASLLGLRPAAGGIWFARMGWARPSELVAHWLAQPRVALHVRACVAQVDRSAAGWCVATADGRTFEAAQLVLAQGPADLPGGAALQPSLGLHQLPLAPVRGQCSLIEGLAPQLKAVLAGAGYLLPAQGSTTVFGASYEHGEAGEDERESSHQQAQAKAAGLWPGFEAAAQGKPRRAWTGVRVVTPDRLPVIGALPDLQAAPNARPGAPQLADMPRLRGAWIANAYGSRGLTYALLGGELIAAQMLGEPLPVERDLADAVDPARFAWRALKRGEGRQRGLHSSP
ncbi:FAD-dependent 5-carboxymethylaminomethyl-2-thiouridine(34) oxidoreductase MnmC [Piscinibacterium candidicorallinum]|uniref:tRNA 5-methylaminomethyl-2-thiouridine biosynthesis bifunctional protein MnmC n=1 Tax=Piscinibacterium candidicorallinum TaxID=1793872 RepID=A0ABV7H884_9BURK